MTTFNEAYIVNDPKTLVIDVQVDNKDYFKDVYLDSIIIDTNTTYNPQGPSTKPFKCIQIEGNKKRYKEVIDIDALPNRMYFIYVLTRGEASPETPCGLKNKCAVCVVYDPTNLYKQGMKQITSNGCSPSLQFLDYIIKEEAFNIALEGGHYVKAIEYWEELNNSNNHYNIVKPCGCHG